MNSVVTLSSPVEYVRQGLWSVGNVGWKCERRQNPLSDGQWLKLHKAESLIVFGHLVDEK